MHGVNHNIWRHPAPSRHSHVTAVNLAPYTKSTETAWNLTKIEAILAHQVTWEPHGDTSHQD